MNTIKISCHLLYSVQALFMEMQEKEELERQDWNLMESKVVKKLIGFL